jgi:hypothetical protein
MSCYLGLDIVFRLNFVVFDNVDAVVVVDVVVDVVAVDFDGCCKVGLLLMTIELEKH